MPVNERAIGDDLVLLSRAAREAGNIAMRYFRQNPKVWIKTGDSPVSEADLAVDAFLKGELLAARPDYGWVSEETGDDRARRPYRRFFVVDPIDGTRGFIERKAAWCISIAVVEDGRPVAGVLECPVLKEHFLAQVGRPALLNGQVIGCAPAGLRRSPLVSCRRSLVARLPLPFSQSAVFETHIPSLAYRIALLSSGRLDTVFIRSGCHDWDIAAADLILEQSGGLLGGMKGQTVMYGGPPFHHDFLLAGTKDNFQDMLDIVHKAELG